jgi:3-hydroxyisobutyrate dehydrogenase
MDNKPTVGVIGLGIMGMAMAKNLQKAGFSVVVTNRGKARRDEAEKGGLTVLNSAREVAEKSTHIIVIVTDPKAVQAVMDGEQGLLSAKGAGKTVIQMSTIDGKSTQTFAAQTVARGMNFLDCPVTGSKKQVEEASLILLAGGESAVLESCRSILLAVGKTIVHAGDIGKGTALKLCMNLIVSQMTTALCESVALAKIQELDVEKIFEVLKNSPALNCGYFNIKESGLLEENFSAAFSLDNMLKDVRFMEQTAKESRLSLPVTQAVRFLMEAGVTEGLGSEDLTSLVKILKPKSLNR